MTVTAQKYLVGALSLVLGGALLAVGDAEVRLRRALAPTAGSAAPEGPLDPQLDRGRQVYERYSCNACHGAAGAGGIQNLNAQTGGRINGLQRVAQSYTREELAQKILAGVPLVEKADPGGPQPPLTMPSYRGLIGAQELEELVDYLFSLAPPPGPAGQDEW